MSARSRVIQHAEARRLRFEVSQARIRLALRCLSEAAGADADPSLHTSREWISALALLGELSNQVAELQKLEELRAAEARQPQLFSAA